MQETLKELVCDPLCGFKVQSHDENEIVSIGLSHTKNMHQLNMTASEIRSQLKTI